MKKMKKNKFIKMFSFIIVPVLALVFGVSLLIGNNIEREVHAVSPSTWQATWQYWQWHGNLPSVGAYVWSDGSNYYYSSSNEQYVLDTATSTWSVKTWNGLTSFRGDYIWTDGTNIYYSASSSQYVLDTATSTWSAKTWTGLTNFNGTNIWTDGTNIYYSQSFNSYVLDTATSTWSSKSWNGIGSLTGQYVWTDGTNIYYSNSSNQYVLDTTTSTWSAKTWTGLTNFNGNDVVKISDYYFYISNSDQYVLDVSTSTWSVYSFDFDNNIVVSSSNQFYGHNIYLIDNVAYFFTGQVDGSYRTLRLVMSNSGSGGDEPVYSFNGNNVDVATDINTRIGSNTMRYMIGYVSVKCDFDYDTDNDEFLIYFTVDYILYLDSSNSQGFTYIPSSFDTFYSSINDLGSANSVSYYSFTPNANGVLIPVIAYDSTYFTYINFNVLVSSGFTSYNFTGVRFYSNYNISNNVYYIQNVIRYFDANDESLDIVFNVNTDTFSNAYTLSNRYYYFNQSQNGGSNSQAYDNGYAAGLQDGETNGYNSGYTEGYTAGTEYGQQYAQDVLVPNAYQNGFSAGELYGASHANEYTFYGLLSAVIDAPISYMTSLFNFNILGVNMLGFITGILTLAVVLFVIKRVV